MKLLSMIGRGLATLAGAAIVLGLTAFLIESQHMDHAHQIKAWVIAGGTIAGGLAVAHVTGKARILIILGVCAAELFNIGSVAEQNWRERASRRTEIVKSNADAKAAYDAAMNAYTSAVIRLEKSEAAKAKADDTVAANNKTKDCKKDCMAGNIAQADKAAAEVTNARANLAANPKPTREPVVMDADAGVANWQWDLGMGILGSIGGNLLAIGLMSLAGSPSSARQKTERAEKVVPQITIADVSAADAVLLEAENERALTAFRKSLTRKRPASKQKPVPPSGGGRRGRKRNPNVVDFVERFRKENGRDPRIPEMQARFPELNKTTLWRNAKMA